MIDLLELIPKAHEAARAKGFWPEDATPNAGQFLMLTIGELGECQEAHRRGRVMDAKFFAGLAGESDNATFKTMFEVTCKDTSGDELGDAYIRLCDFVGGFMEADSPAWIAAYTDTMRRSYSAKRLPENFGAALLHIVRSLAEVEDDFMPVRLCASFYRMEELATREGIDLAQHIALKLRYNSLRPAKHGKAY